MSCRHVDDRNEMKCGHSIDHLFHLDIHLAAGRCISSPSWHKEKTAALGVVSISQEICTFCDPPTICIS